MNPFGTAKLHWARETRRKSEGIAEILNELYPEPPVPLDHDSPFTLLVAVLLSAQTTDVRVNLVTPALFDLGRTPEKLSCQSEAEILECIRTCGLAPGKAKAIKKLSQILVEEHGGQVPADFEALERLPGVGHKTASVVMAQAFGVPAFPVDTHIHRLAARWGLSQAKNVEQTERDLKRLFPREDWNRAHLQIIFFGREHCPAQRHDLEQCPICSFAATKKRIREEAQKNAPRKRAAHRNPPDMSPQDPSSSTPSGPSESLQRIWEALDRGEPEEALILIGRARDQDSAHHAAEATARMDLGDLEGARTALTNAMHAQESDIDLDILWADAELSLREWRIEVAKDRFEQLLEVEPHAALHERLALCCDLLGLPKEADDHLARAAAIDPEGFPLPPRFSEAEIGQFLEQAASALPEAFRAALERAEVRVEPVPTRALAEAGPPGETPPDALGFFVGHSALEDPSADLPELPPVIYLFQRNLERACTDREQLEEELLVTLHHELAHLLGFDEDGVEALGLE